MGWFMPAVWQLNFVAGRLEFMRGDPLLHPDIPGNEPQLWRRSLVDDFDLSCVNQDDFTMQGKLWKNFLPTWFRYSEFPPEPTERVWSYIRKYDENYTLMEDRRFHFPRQVRQMEIAIKEGHERILIRDRVVSLYAQWLQRIGDYFDRNARFYGSLGFWTAFCFPRRYKWYAAFSFYAIIHAYCYMHFWRTDRLSRYKMFELPVEGMDKQHDKMYLDEEFWVLELIPRSKNTAMYFKNQLFACGACLYTAWRMMQVEEIIVGGPAKNIFEEFEIMIQKPYILPMYPPFRCEALGGIFPHDTWRPLTAIGCDFGIDTFLLMGITVFYAWEEYYSLKREFYKFYTPYKLAVDNRKVPGENKDWIF